MRVIVTKSYNMWCPKKYSMAGLTDRCIEYSRSLRLGDHAVSLLDDKADRWRLVSAYFREALDHGTGVLYSCYFEDPDSVRTSLNEHGIDTERHERQGDLRLIELTDLLKNSQFGEIRAEITKVLKQLPCKEGAVRESGDGVAAFRMGYGDEIIALERYLGTRLKLPMTALCTYDVPDLFRSTDETGTEFNQLTQLIKAHGHVIFPGMAFPQTE